MGQKTVRFSDLSGQLITQDDALARIVVHEHPELGDSPVEFEALTDEVMVIEKSALRVAVVELRLPGEDEPRRVTVEAEAFDRLATDRPMNELLITARPVRPARRGAKSPVTTRDGRPNYGTLEHAGEPHKGKITEAERQLVRDHLEEINERLVSQGLRTISLTDPEHVERYGLTDLAQLSLDDLESAVAPPAESDGQLDGPAAQGDGQFDGPAAGPAANEQAEASIDTSIEDDLATEESGLPIDDEIDPPLDADDLPEVQVRSRSRSRRR
ncbi:MAG TPA: hypothetical protein VKV33_01750 [Streptosporangiaceae bacterium]|nr:hypothetical protein [Streptosporangiaceae bacterium]